jgi:hypothetical protein
MSHSEPSIRVHPPQDHVVRELATLLQLARRAREAQDAPALGFVAVNESRQLFPYRQAALGRANLLASLLPAEVMSVSGLPQPDPQAPYVQWLGHVFRHLSASTQAETAPRSLRAQDLPETIAADWHAWLPEHVLFLPLVGPDRERFGDLLLAREEAWDAHDLALGAELADAYGHALARFVPATSWYERARQWLLPKTRRWTFAAVIAAVILCPVRMSVLAPAEVVPQEPFLVRAPLDGVVDRFHVRPNQIVKAGDPLFDLDTTALRSRLGVTRKAYDVAEEEYRQAAQMALSDEKSKRDMVLKKGRLDEKAVELDYSQQLLDRVQVKAQRDGVAVFADVNDWQGRAVAIGERVLVLADPAKTELTISLPVADAAELESGASVTLYPNGAAFSSFEATLTSAMYQAEPTPEGILAYRLKARFDSGQALPRLGQMGMAKVRAGWTPLSYYVLRRPLAAARQWLGW